MQAGAADDLGRVADAEPVIAGVDALRGERQGEVLAANEPGPVQDRRHDLFGGARIGGGFEDDEIAGPQMIADGFCRAPHGGEVGQAVAQWCRYADHNDFSVRQRGRLRRGGTEAGVE